MSKAQTTSAITLIALIVTIIVLLILAGVAITTLAGENGILERARLAKEKTVEATDDENSKLSSYENEFNSIYNRNTITLTEQDYNEILNKIDTLEEEQELLKNQMNYSTDEIKVGKWTNGKPIYRLVVYYSNRNLPGSTWHTVKNVSSYNIERLVHSEILCTQSTSSIGCAFTQVLNGNLQIYSTVGINGDGIIIEYTKTTDAVPTN